jgi:hypothetical protein
MLLPKLKEEEDRELKSQRFFFLFSYVREREREESVFAFFFFLARDAPDKKNISPGRKSPLNVSIGQASGWLSVRGQER